MSEFDHPSKAVRSVLMGAGFPVAQADAAVAALAEWLDFEFAERQAKLENAANATLTQGGKGNQ